MKRGLLIFITILLFTLTACGGGQPSENNAANSAKVELSETFTSTNIPSGTLSFKYPSGWVVDESIPGIVAMYAGENTAENLFLGLDDNQVALQFVLQTSTGESALDFATSLITGITGSVGDTSETELMSVARTTVNDTYDVAVYARTFGSEFVGINTYTAPGKYNDYAATLEAIVASVEFTSQ